MASQNAKALAQDVIAAYKKGGKIVMGKMVEKRGYSKTVIKTPSKVTTTKSYQKEIEPLLTRYRKELDEIIAAMARKNKNSEQYRTLVDASDKVQKQIQLLSGGVTERVQISGMKIIKE